MATARTIPDRAPSPRIDPARLDLVREFRANPIGRHSADLDAALSLLRSGDVAGKYCLICLKPHAEWVIGRLSGRRGEGMTVEDNRVFHSVEDAEWAVFKLRWAAACGVAIDEDAL
jgi:hypothetical protein